MNFVSILKISCKNIRRKCAVLDVIRVPFDTTASVKKVNNVSVVVILLLKKGLPLPRI